jgi:DNA-binding FrmR family transcriptional regulator
VVGVLLAFYRAHAGTDRDLRPLVQVRTSHTHRGIVRRALEIPDDVIDDIRRRLHRVSGQLAGIERMLDDGRECKDVVTQISAATRALEQAGFKLVAAGLTYCLTHPEEAEAAGYPLGVVEKMFLKLA